jgi:Mg-chelatase subunit ChlD
MSTHPNSSNSGSLLGKIIVFAFFVILISQFFTTRKTAVNTSAPPIKQLEPVTSVQNPIEQMVRPPAKVAQRDGIGVALLMDTSGSMDEKVRDQNGQAVPKIQISRRSTMNLLRQIDRFAQSHKDRVIQVGVYEFSARNDQPLCRVVIPLGPLNLPAAESRVQAMYPEGGTPIGDAIITAKHDLDLTGLSHRHILVVTDGENNQGYSPGDVANVISRQPEEDRASLYFIAFDVAAEKFKAVRDAGGLVLPAADEPELQQTLDYVLTGKILAEQPEIPKSKK